MSGTIKSIPVSADEQAIAAALDSVEAEIEKAGSELAKQQSRIAALEEDRQALRAVLVRRTTRASAGRQRSAAMDDVRDSPHHAGLLYVLEFPIPVWIGALAAVLHHDGPLSTKEIAEILTQCAPPHRWRMALDPTRIAPVLSHHIAGKLLGKSTGRNQPVGIRKGKTEKDVKAAITGYLDKHWPRRKIEIKARRK
jgi:hypothetical protein